MPTLADILTKYLICFMRSMHKYIKPMYVHKCMAISAHLHTSGHRKLVWLLVQMLAELVYGNIPTSEEVQAFMSMRTALPKRNKRR